MPFPTRQAHKLQGSCICQWHGVQSSLQGLVSPPTGRLQMASYKGPLDYIDVATRIIEFREKFPHGSLQSWKDPYVIEVKMPDGSIKSYMVYSAAAYRSPDDTLPGVGWAYEPIPGPTNFTRDSELQNAETAAWGRAMVAALAVDTKKGIASSEEVRNRQTKTTEAPQAKAPAPKREYTEEEKAKAVAIYAKIEIETDFDKLKEAWTSNADLLDVVIDRFTLRDHILARRAALNG
jgi:hypothetical protein